LTRICEKKFSASLDLPAAKPPRGRLNGADPSGAASCRARRSAISSRLRVDSKTKARPQLVKLFIDPLIARQMGKEFS
jgi:hypothetical protein